MGLSTTHRKQANAELPPLFRQSFLDKETRSYESISMEQLAGWSRMLGGMVPDAEGLQGTQGEQGLQGLEAGQGLQAEQAIDWYSPEITQVTDLYAEEKSEKFPNYYAEQSMYFTLPYSERTAFLRNNPDLKEYWDWKGKWNDAYPEYKDFFNGNVYKTIDTSSWSPQLLYYVQDYAMTGNDLPEGAMSLLHQMWIKEGKPYGSLESWVSGSVAPSVLNGMR